MTGAGISLTKYLFGEFIGDFLYAPVWWYSRGFLKLLGVLRGRLIRFERTLGLRLWIRTLGKPMYGQYDVAGKLISLFMRFFILIVRTATFVLYTIFLGVLAVLWLIVPIFVIWQIVKNFVGLLTV